MRGAVPYRCGSNSTSIVLTAGTFLGGSSTSQGLQGRRAVIPSLARRTASRASSRAPQDRRPAHRLSRHDFRSCESPRSYEPASVIGERAVTHASSCWIQNPRGTTRYPVRSRPLTLCSQASSKASGSVMSSIEANPRFAGSEPPDLLEPEGPGTTEFYPNGSRRACRSTFSAAVVRSIQFSRTRPVVPYRYAIEYLLDPRGPKATLETTPIAASLGADQRHDRTGSRRPGLLASLTRAIRPCQPGCTPGASVVPRRLVDTCYARRFRPYRHVTSRARLPAARRQPDCASQRQAAS